MKLNDEIIKVRKDYHTGGVAKYPYNILPFLPDTNCAFDSYRGTVGFDIFPFSVTTRISSSNQVFIKIYEETDTD